jgi:hypothetical protein
MLNSAESPIEVAPVDFIEMGRDVLDQAVYRGVVFEDGVKVAKQNQRAAA